MGFKLLKDLMIENVETNAEGAIAASYANWLH